MRKTASLSRAMVLLLALAALAACTREQMTQGAAASARNWCSHAPNCTVQPDRPAGF